MVTRQEILNAIQEAGMTNSAVCVHVSLRSFGGIDGGADTLIDAFLESGCTLLVPTFTLRLVAPPAGWSLRQNGLPSSSSQNAAPLFPGYSVMANDVTIRKVGHFPEAVLARSERIRGNHPLNSFAALGPLAHRLIDGQALFDVYAPLKALNEVDGFVALLGVGLNTMTLLHLAEEQAGRRLFRRWGSLADGTLVECEVGSCSEGFPKFQSSFDPITVNVSAGLSQWSTMRSAEACRIAGRIIADDPQITHCDDPNCVRCHDAILGGPIFDEISSSLS